MKKEEKKILWFNSMFAYSKNKSSFLIKSIDFLLKGSYIL